MICVILSLWYLYPNATGQDQNVTMTPNLPTLNWTIETTAKTTTTHHRRRRNIATEEALTGPKYQANPSPPVNCTTPSCECSKYDASESRTWGMFRAGACLPWNGNYSIFIACQSLSNAWTGDFDAVDCTEKTHWSVEPYESASLSTEVVIQQDRDVITPYTSVKGGLWLFYGYTGLSWAYVNGSQTQVPCKRWILFKHDQFRTEPYSYEVCRLNVSRPTPNEFARERGSKISLFPDTMMGLATGVTGEQNNWLLLAEQAAQAVKADCVVCMKPRPLLRVVPAAIPVQHVATVLTTYMLKDNLTIYDKAYPLTPRVTTGPVFHNIVPIGLNFTCLKLQPLSSSTGDIGHIDDQYCAHTIDFNSTEPLVSRADLYYWCRTNRLRGFVPTNSTGLCALVSVILPVKIFPLSASDILNFDPYKITALGMKSQQHRAKRETKPWMIDDPTYIDAIGVPRGVPDEYKLVDQVAAGFENIPIISAVFPITPNKNVDRINYIHYNVQKLGNYTYDGLQAVHAQLEATSLTAFQNRIALDMLLAEKGGVCALFPAGECCTFIPMHTAPDGRLTKVLERLQMFNDRLKDQSGVDTSMWDDWLDIFGKYKTLVQSVLISIALFAALLTLCGCCCIPCIRALLQKLIERALGPIQQALMQEERVALMILDPDDDLPDDVQDTNKRPTYNPPAYQSSPS